MKPVLADLLTPGKILAVANAAQELSKARVILSPNELYYIIEKPRNKKDESKKTHREKAQLLANDLNLVLDSDKSFLETNGYGQIFYRIKEDNILTKMLKSAAENSAKLGK